MVAGNTSIGHGSIQDEFGEYGDQHFRYEGEQSPNGTFPGYMLSPTSIDLPQKMEVNIRKIICVGD